MTPSEALADLAARKPAAALMLQPEFDRVAVREIEPDAGEVSR